jgi:hypothetical protein
LSTLSISSGTAITRRASSSTSARTPSRRRSGPVGRPRARRLQTCPQPAPTSPRLRLPQDCRAPAARLASNERVWPSRGALRSPDDPPLEGSSRVSDAAARWADNLSQKSSCSRSEPPKTSAFFAAAPQSLVAREPFERRGRGGRSIRVPRPAPANLPRRRLPPTPAAARKRRKAQGVRRGGAGAPGRCQSRQSVASHASITLQLRALLRAAPLERDLPGSEVCRSVLASLEFGISCRSNSEDEKHPGASRTLLRSALRKVTPDFAYSYSYLLHDHSSGHKYAVARELIALPKCASDTRDREKPISYRRESSNANSLSPTVPPSVTFTHRR